MAIGRKKKPGKQKQKKALWDRTAEGPREQVPESVKMARRSRRMRFAVWAVLLLFPVSVLGNLFQVATSLNTVDDEPIDLTSEYNETRSVALNTVTQWLETVPAPLPGGRLVGWDSARVQEWEPTIDEDTGEPNPSDPPPYRVEAHKVTLAAAGGTLFHASVAVGYDDMNGAVALSTPSLMPYTPSNEGWRPSEFPNHEETEVTDPIEKAVENWAAAYTNGDPAQLIQVVRDRNEDHSYVPLTGARLIEVGTGGAWIADPLNPDDEPDPNEIFVRVTAQIEWAATPVPEDVTDRPVVSFDVLIQDALTAAPYVTAWGGPGEGPYLIEHQNAVTNRDVVLGDDLVDEEDVATDDETEALPDAAAGTGGETTPPAKKKKKRKKRKNNQATNDTDPAAAAAGE